MDDTEMVDVVDENCTVLSAVSKQEAHQQGLLHKTVISEVMDSQGRWLLIKQASHKQDVGQYVSPMGGHVQAGENDVDALKREAKEELGLEGDFKFEYVNRVILNRQVRDKQENHYFIVYKIYSDFEPILNEESESFKYFTEEELKTGLRDNPELFGKAFIFLVQECFPHLLQ